MPPTNKALAPEAVIAEAEEAISYWEAKKATQPFDGFTGLVRVCDSERKEEAGIVFPRLQPHTPTGVAQVADSSAAASHTAVVHAQTTIQLQAATSMAAINRKEEQQLPSDALDPGVEHATVAAELDALDNNSDDSWVQQYLLTGVTQDTHAHIDPAAPTSHALSAGSQGMQVQQPRRQDAGAPATTSGTNGSTSRAAESKPGAHTLPVPGRQPGQPVTAAMLQRAILRKAVQAARVEAHNQLDWVEDLPRAPTTPVPPKPPQNP